MARKIKYIYPSRENREDRRSPIYAVYAEEHARDGGDKKKAKARNLVDLSSTSARWNTSLIENSFAKGSTETSNTALNSFNSMYGGNDNIYLNPYADVVGQDEYIPYYDKRYSVRRQQLRDFAKNPTIETCLDIISNEAIVYDTNGYFANLDIKLLSSVIKPDKKGRKSEVLDGLVMAFREVYRIYNFHVSDDAWNLFKSFLIDGILAFEIIYEYTTENGIMKATGIAGFKQLDPTTLYTKIKKVEGVGDVKVWIQETSGGAIEIPDSNIIYISYSGKYNNLNVSYLERLSRSYNILNQLEGSRVIWNLMNAQKRTKIVVPMGSMPPQKMRTELAQFEAFYKEDISIDSLSGEVNYNSRAKFPFAKTMVFPSNAQGTTDVSSIGDDGYDMNSTQTLEYFWDRFIQDTQIPRNRFPNSVGKGMANPYDVSSSITHEEHNFHRFINRLRVIFKEILIKPTWIQFALMHPEYAKHVKLKAATTIEFIDENIFVDMKESERLKNASEYINSLLTIQEENDSSYIPASFAISKFLNLSADDMIELNAAREARKKHQEKMKEEGEAQNGGGFGQMDSFGGGIADFDDGGGFDVGGSGGGLGGGDFGGAPDMGGGDLGGADTGADTAGEPAL